MTIGLTEPVTTPIDAYLAAQADLSAVEHFARSDVHDRTGQWSSLIPLTMPKPGEQFRFEVDLDLCSGCKACVTACHNLNGLDDGESFRSVGLLMSTSTGMSQSITTSCHHCVEPGCLEGCPANAYEKDPITGIVRHLDDACIGCQYCTLTCPYDVPLYNERLGIVRKCDMCADRLADGEAPACVQGCPNHAITISTVGVANIANGIADVPQGVEPRLVPGAASSRLTLPTTTYRSGDGPSSLWASDPDEPAANGRNEGRVLARPGHGHTPLVLMLVLTQMAIGLHIARMIVGGVASSTATMAVAAALVMLATGAGLAASVLHLGQPAKAWRAVLGVRHSWLSREVVAFTGFAVLAAASAVATWTEVSGATWVGVVTAIVGVLAMGCSVQIYAVTKRRWWRVEVAGAKFALTSAVTGIAVLLATLLVVQAMRAETAFGLATPRWMALLVAIFTVGKLVVDVDVLRARDVEQQATAQLLLGELSGWSTRRMIFAVAGGVVGPILIVGSLSASWPMLTALVAVGSAVLVFMGELVERHLFFRASAVAHMFVDGPRPPSGV